MPAELDCPEATRRKGLGGANVNPTQTRGLVRQCATRRLLSIIRALLLSVLRMVE
jgi:hypothetical protein